MAEALTTIRDFDFRLDEILLVHKNRFVEGYVWNSYRSGRLIDGLVLCVSGRGTFVFPTETLTLEKGQMFFLSSDDAYIVKNGDPEPFVHYTANFRLSRDAEALSASPFLSTLLSGRSRYVTDPAQFPRYRDTFDELLSVWQAKGSGYRVIARSLLYRLLYDYLIETERRTVPSDAYLTLLPALELLDRAYAEEHPVAELARTCRLSETHFRRLFTRFYGCSPAEYRKRKRILHAKNLLLSGAYSVAEAARMSGFSDPNYFARLFRKEIGMSPTEYVRQFF